MKIALVAFIFILSGTAIARDSGLEGYYLDTLNQARNGDATAMYDIAGMYARGVGIDLDTDKALYWYQESAQAGYSRGAYKLGKLYSEDAMVSQNNTAAFRWYKVAADLGYKDARARVSAMYRAGEGVEKDLDAADEWSKPAENKTAAVKPHVKEKARKKAAVKKPALSTLEIVARNMWSKQQRHAIYLPSKSTYCNEDEGKLICTSKRIPGQQLNKQYIYRVKSTLKNFTPDGHFDAEIEFQLVDIIASEIEGYGQEEGDMPIASTKTIVEELRNRREMISCDISQNKTPITCMSASGRKVAYSVRSS